jgi:hypothetical protein
MVSKEGPHRLRVTTHLQFAIQKAMEIDKSSVR